jgi:signal transduction histidine kinase
MWPFALVGAMPWLLIGTVALTAACAVPALRMERAPDGPAGSGRWAGSFGWPLVAALVGVAAYGEASVLVPDVMALGHAAGYRLAVPDLSPDGPLAVGLLLGGLLAGPLLPLARTSRPRVLPVSAVVAGELLVLMYPAMHVEGVRYVVLSAVGTLVFARVQGAGRWALLLPAVVVMVGGLLGLDLWSAPEPDTAAVLAVAGWVAGLAVLVASLVAAVRWPRVAADLAALGLVGAGAYDVFQGAFGRSLVVVRTYGDLAAPPAPLPVGIGHNMAVIGGIQGALLLALGLWLLPLTVLPDVRRLLGREPDPALTRRVQRLTETRAEAVSSAAAELRRIERDLHDGAQGRLVAIGMNLRAAEDLMASRPEEAAALVTEARVASAAALEELRGLVRGIYPPVLADRGLAEAVRALALDLPLPCETEIDLPERLAAPLESACYFAVAEVVTNAVRHASARTLRIRMARTDGLLRIEVQDDGLGGADPAAGSGLAGVERRLSAFDGILAISSPAGGPTIAVMEVPCA